MRRWIRERRVEAVLILLIVGIIGVLVLGVMSGIKGCHHGHHQGVCGREYQTLVGKVLTKKTCDCVKDHY
jgi:hypothetical protein